jgi:hypothetical protein
LPHLRRSCLHRLPHHLQARPALHATCVAGSASDVAPSAGMGEAFEPVPVSMMLPPQVRRSTALGTCLVLLCGPAWSFRRWMLSCGTSAPPDQAESKSPNHQVLPMAAATPTNYQICPPWWWMPAMLNSQKKSPAPPARDAAPAVLCQAGRRRYLRGSPGGFHHLVRSAGVGRPHGRPAWQASFVRAAFVEITAAPWRPATRRR